MTELEIEKQILEKQLELLHLMLEKQRDICDEISEAIEGKRARIAANMQEQMEVANVK
jgi:hypothetical protein